MAPNNKKIWSFLKKNILVLDIFSLFFYVFLRISEKNLPTYPPGELWVELQQTIF